MKPLQGKVAIVTGVSSPVGIGAAVARRLAASGARLVLAADASPFLASQAVLPSMRRRGGGRIVHIASQLGSVAYQTRTVYGMTKAALIHLAKSMALELAADNIQVNTVSPGPIATQPILDRQRDEPEESARRLEYVPMGRFGRPEEIGEVVHWLLTTESSYLTGHDLVVDGGYTIH